LFTAQLLGRQSGRQKGLQKQPAKKSERQQKCDEGPGRPQANGASAVAKSVPTAIAITTTGTGIAAPPPVAVGIWSLFVYLSISL
jgi:hypothetical protein